MLAISPINFNGIPRNYAKIDSYVSRSAQPFADDFLWLSEHGVTDIINFRTMYKPEIDFSEPDLVRSLGMNYYNIPSHTQNPTEENIIKFLEIINKIKQNNGKAHIHCMAGADRTGMYAYIYKMLNGLGSACRNENEWIWLGHNRQLYPDLIPKTKELLKKLNDF